MDDKVMNDPLGIQAGNVDALLRRVETGQTTETDAEQLRRLLRDRNMRRHDLETLKHLMAHGLIIAICLLGLLFLMTL